MSTSQTGANAKRTDNLPLIFQEVLTVIARLRAQRQKVGEAEVFRGQVRAALKQAEQDGLRRGYTLEDLRVATFAVVALLDESILNSHNPVFADWPRRPLQQELFGVDIAGETFFRNIERLLAREDSQNLADLLEVHQLCLLLGFRGRYSAAGTAEIRSVLEQIETKIRPVRSNSAVQPTPKPEIVVAARDRWVPILSWTAIACFVLAAVLFTFFRILLSDSVNELRTLAAEIRL